jgi:hypothetical protein
MPLDWFFRPGVVLEVRAGERGALVTAGGCPGRKL